VAAPHPRSADEGAAQIRAFLAIALPDAVRGALSRLVALLRVRPGADRVRWAPAENLHVTLRFLGNVDAAVVPTLLETLARETARVAPLDLQLGAPKLFPSSRRPRVVALAVGPEAPLQALALAALRGVVAAGLPGETRPFRPHLTLGRIRDRRGGRLDRTPDVTVSDTPVPDPVRVDEIVLYRSELQRSGARHTSLGRVPLGDAAGGSSNHPEERDPRIGSRDDTEDPA